MIRQCTKDAQSEPTEFTITVVFMYSVLFLCFLSTNFSNKKSTQYAVHWNGRLNRVFRLKCDLIVVVAAAAAIFRFDKFEHDKVNQSTSHFLWLFWTHTSSSRAIACSTLCRCIYRTQTILHAHSISRRSIYICCCHLSNASVLRFIIIKNLLRGVNLISVND